MHGRLDTIRLLLDRGADKEAKDKVRGEGKGVVGRWMDGRCVAVQCVVEGAWSGPVASAEEAKRGLLAPSKSPCLRAFPAELEPTLLPHVLDSCALSNARKFCFLRGSAEYPTCGCVCVVDPLL